MEAGPDVHGHGGGGREQLLGVDAPGAGAVQVVHLHAAPGADLERRHALAAAAAPAEEQLAGQQAAAAQMLLP